jgi:hypothetical protein
MKNEMNSNVSINIEIEELEAKTAPDAGTAFLD